MLLALLLACFGASDDPCADYCDAVCDCDPGATCDDCHAVYDEADATLQDECEAAVAEYSCDSGGA